MVRLWGLLTILVIKRRGRESKERAQDRESIRSSSPKRKIETSSSSTRHTALSYYRKYLPLYNYTQSFQPLSLGRRRRIYIIYASHCTLATCFFLWSFFCLFVDAHYLHFNCQRHTQFFFLLIKQICNSKKKSRILLFFFCFCFELIVNYYNIVSLWKDAAAAERAYTILIGT